MEIVNDFKDYELIDASNGLKYERWKDVYLLRPDPQVIWDNGDLKEKYKDVIQDRYKELLKVSMKQEYNIKGVCNFENYEENSLAS